MAELGDEFKERVLLEFRHVREDMKELGDKVDRKDETRFKDISDIRVELGMLKVKAGLIAGLIGSIGGAVAAALVSLLFKGHP
jgi:hypothetical protein